MKITACVVEMTQNDGCVGVSVMMPQSFDSELIALTVSRVIRYALERGVSMGEIQDCMRVEFESTTHSVTGKPVVVMSPPKKDAN